MPESIKRQFAFINNVWTSSYSASCSAASFTAAFLNMWEILESRKLYSDKFKETLVGFNSLSLVEYVPEVANNLDNKKGVLNEKSLSFILLNCGYECLLNFRK